MTTRALNRCSDDRPKRSRRPVAHAWRTSGALAALLFTAGQLHAETPYLVEEFEPGPGDAILSNLAVQGGLAYFRAWVTGLGYEPWRSDGTPEGTFLIHDIRTGWNESSNPAIFGRIGDDVIFAVTGPTSPTLFATRGVAGDLINIKENFVPWGTDVAATDAALFLGGSEIGTGGDAELWQVARGTLAVTRVADVNPGPLASQPEELVAVDNVVFFRGYDGLVSKLIRSDGTTVGTGVVSNPPAVPFIGSPDELARVGDQLFLSGISDDHGGELWMVTPGGVPTVLDVCPGTCGAGAGAITGVGDIAYYRSLGNYPADGTTGAELWRSDGTLAGTWKVREIGPGTRPGYIQLITALDDIRFFFTADDGVHGQELWISDGTEAGTRMLKDIHPSAGGLEATFELLVHDGYAYFPADDGVNGEELWVSDGTTTGTRMLVDHDPAPGASSGPGFLAAVPGALLYSATDPTHGYALWAVELPLFRDGFELRWSSVVSRR